MDGHLDKAQKEITNALHASPNCALALDIQAAIYLRTGHLDDAAAQFQRAIDADPAMGQAYVGIGILLIARKEYKDALVPLDRAASLLPTTWLVYFETGIAHLALGNLEDALKQIRRAEMFAAPDPEKRSATAYLHALLSIKSQDFKSAIGYMNDAIKFSPNGSYAKPALAKIEQLKPLIDDDKGTLAENSALQ
jgi:tetratricopeptide (TPR) repeat protein